MNMPAALAPEHRDLIEPPAVLGPRFEELA